MPSPSSSPSPTASASTPPTYRKPSRQRPGTACEECRRRKLRCDGKQPQCEACFEAGVPCVNDAARSPRGPKKGHMKALQVRIALLEKSLQEHQEKATLPSLQALDLPEMSSIDSIFHMNASGLPTPPSGPNADNLSMDLCDDLRMFNSLEAPAILYIPDLLRTDLEQIYFERAHPFVPILHQRRHFAWARHPTKTESQICLQYSMWTLAASLSAQQEHIRESLYECTRRMLDASDPKDGILEFSDIEHVQARIILLIYELMRTNHQRAWISAGRCFRLLQLMRLYEIDTPENVGRRKSDPDPEAAIKTEEKRRTFWMAYSLDRFISMRGGLPLTLNEQGIVNRLPMPEEEFQKGQQVETDFLTEAIVAENPVRSSPFTESIILATIGGQALAHCQQFSAERAYNNVSQTFWGRHEWICELVRTRVDTLMLNYPPASQHSDSLLLFTNMVAHATILSMCKVMESGSWESTEYWNACVEFKQRALLAAKEIVILSRSLAHLSYFKIHPFTPLPLAFCMEFFKTHRYLDETVDSQVQEISDVLKEITGVNNLA